MLRSGIAELYSSSIYNIPTYGSPHQGMGPDETMSLPLLPILAWLFLYIFSYKKKKKICSASIQVIFSDSCSIFSCNLVVSMGEGDLKIFLLCHLDPTLLPQRS